MRLSRFIPSQPAVPDSAAALAAALVSVGLLASCGTLVGGQSSAFAQRSLGIDVSAWQGNISQNTWNNLHNVNDRDFVFIRSSRGGTTGFYNQSDPNNSNGQNSLSQRYDDPYFSQNITRATNAGMFAGSYHFSRPDILANTGADEADHFIQMAGPWMRPGYLLPVHDLEAGDGFRSGNAIAQFALDFSNRIDEVMGIRPAIYMNGNYANYVVGGASASLRNQVVATYPTLWSARPQNNPDVQHDHPSTSLSWIYGPWDDPPNLAQPWSFWQYSWTGQLSSYNGHLDLNVAQGGAEFLKDRLVPALWTTASDGEWTALANWNSGQAPIAPVQGPGQAARVGALSLPAVRLPTANDTVILDRSDADITVTLSSGSHDIRKLMVYEALNITGGSLVVNYVPSDDDPTAQALPLTARFSAPVSLSGGSLSVHTLQVDATQTFSVKGALAFDTLQLMPHPSTPARLTLEGDLDFTPLNNNSAAIVAGAGTGSSGIVDLGGFGRIWRVADGDATVDLAVQVPITNGGLTKAGAGILELTGLSTYQGDTTIVDGSMIIATPFLADAADVYLSNAGVLSLDFVGTDVVDSLFINGISQPVGTWGGSGSGADFTSPLLSGTGLLQVSTFESPIPGDFNNDGAVDSEDLVQWYGNLGQNGESDADGDGDSDGADFLAWQRNHGTTAGPQASPQSIPEPSAALLCIGWIVLRLGRRVA